MIKCNIKKSGIYLIKNNINGKVYVGSTLNFSSRIRRHRADLNKNVHHSKYLQRSYIKYGFDYFEFIIIEYCDKHELLISEQFWINYFDSYNNGYNTTPIAGNCLGYKQSDEHKKKISDSLKGYKRTEENKINMSLANKGKILSDETKNKISNSLKGNKVSDETKEKISKTMLKIKQKNN